MSNVQLFTTQADQFRNRTSSWVSAALPARVKLKSQCTTTTFDTSTPQFSLQCQVSTTVPCRTNKRLCYCRGTARRAASVEILWPFLTELLTRSSANPEEPREHNVSCNRVKCCTNVRRIACENVCNRWMTFSVIQGHCCCHHLIGHILFPISLPW